MDEARARYLYEQLKNNKVGDWTIIDYIDHGKSAVVFEGRKGKKHAAIKIFDPELIDKVGKEKQRGRVERELSLIGKHHDNLIDILDGGICKNTGFIFIVMKLFNGKNLSKVLKEIPNYNIKLIIHQISEAAQFLENLSIAHRDIKPENIGISKDFKHAVLLDLGVIKPVGGLANLTDGPNSRPFIGTLRYSSPEFLFREEPDTKEGWRALTFYQLGAVLHDLIMKTPIFEKYSEPFARLVEAVKNVTPQTKSKDVPIELVQLTRNCLVKDPEVRLKIVSWQDFNFKSSLVTEVSAIKERICQRKLIGKMESSAKKPSSIEREKYKEDRMKYQLYNLIEKIIVDECVSSGCFPPLEIKSIEKNNDLYFFIQFGKSDELKLPGYFRIYIAISIIDLKSNTIELKYFATISYNNVDVAKIEGHYKPLYKGVADKEYLKKSISTILYRLIEQAQEDFIFEGEGQHPKSIPDFVQEVILNNDLDKG